MARHRWLLPVLGVALATWTLATFVDFVNEDTVRVLVRPAPAAIGAVALDRHLLSEGEVEEMEEVEEVEEPGEYEAWWQEQLERRMQVARTCAALGPTKPAKRDTFLYDPEHRLLFCRNAKVGKQTTLRERIVD